MATTQVMIVEDQQMLVMGLRNILQRLGYNVSDVAASGDEALEKAGEKHHDVILMDIRLKGDMDGIEAARLVREQYDIPVIFVSAYADEDTLERASQAQPYGFLVKPFDDGALQRTIDMAVYKHSINEPPDGAPKGERKSRLAGAIVRRELMHRLNNELAYVLCALESLGEEEQLPAALRERVGAATEHLNSAIGSVAELQHVVPGAGHLLVGRGTPATAAEPSAPPPTPETGAPAAAAAAGPPSLSSL
jgi:CheY-like chemotaxis protein